MKKLIMFLLACLAMAVFCCLMFLKMFTFTYKTLTDKKLVAQVECHRIDSRSSEVVVRYSSMRVVYVVPGRGWDVRVDMVQWNDLLKMCGVKPRFKLISICGRPVDKVVSPVWGWLMRKGDSLPGIAGVYGSAVFQGEGKFNVYLDNTSLFVVHR